MILVRPYKSNKKHHKGETGESTCRRKGERGEGRREGRKRETKGRVSDNNEMAKVDNGHIWGHVLYSVHVHSYQSTRHSI